MSEGESARTTTRRDWYWFLGRLGQTLIAIGVLMFLFVGYQLWGTGIEESQAQDRLASQFEDRAMTPLPVSPTPTSEPPSTSANEPATREPIVVNEGDAIALIDIPSIGVTKYVVAGVGSDDLKKGPGHYPSTPQPGHLGNMAIAGHRTTYGEPFRHIDELEPGDDVIVTDITGRAFYYVVDSRSIVAPNDSHVVATTDPTVARLTLTTCHPEFSAKQRLVVSAVLDTTRSSVVDDHPFVYAKFLESGRETPTVSVNDSSSTSVIAASDQPVSTEAPDVVETSNDTESDSFSRGWFSDTDAWPQLIAWSAIEGLVIALGWFVARRSRRWIGVVTVVIPFFFVLYFVFQNVNRLLPPNL